MARHVGRADRQQPQRGIAQQLDHHAAGADEQHRPVERIVAGADDGLDARHHLLHQKAIDAGAADATPRAEATSASAAASTASRLLRPSATPPASVLCRMSGERIFERHRKADRLRGRGRLRRRSPPRGSSAGRCRSAPASLRDCPATDRSRARAAARRRAARALRVEPQRVQRAQGRLQPCRNGKPRLLLPASDVRRHLIDHAPEASTGLSVSSSIACRAGVVPALSLPGTGGPGEHVDVGIVRARSRRRRRRPSASRECRHRAGSSARCLPA